MQNTSLDCHVIRYTLFSATVVTDSVCYEMSSFFPVSVEFYVKLLDFREV